MFTHIIPDPLYSNQGFYQKEFYDNQGKCFKRITYLKNIQFRPDEKPSLECFKYDDNFPEGYLSFFQITNEKGIVSALKTPAEVYFYGINVLKERWIINNRIISEKEYHQETKYFPETKNQKDKQGYISNYNIYEDGKLSHIYFYDFRGRIVKTRIYRKKEKFEMEYCSSICDNCEICYKCNHVAK